MGTIIENNSIYPYIDWDKPNSNNYEKLDYLNVWAVDEDILELVKGSVLTPQYEIY